MIMRPTAPLLVLLCLVLPACGDDGDATDLAVVADLSAVADLSIPCTKVGTWPGIGVAFFTPLAHGGKDVATIRSKMDVTGGGDGGSRTDQLVVEVRTSPGASVAYPRSITLEATTTYEGCDACVTLGRDVVGGVPAKRYLARSGHLFLSRVDQSKEGRFEMMGGDFHLVEWSDADTPVAGGECYDVGNVTFSMAYTQGPITGQTDM